jgi:hypothetical protein
MRRTLLSLLVSSAIYAPALADVPALSGLPCAPVPELGLSERDAFRLEHLMTSRSRGLAGALLSDVAADRAAIEAFYSAGLAPIASLPEGKYRCRTVKLGGITPLVIYSWFECEISSADGELRIEKLTGSQRFSGTLTPSAEGLTYVGALHYSDEGPRPYEGASERDQVGCMLKAFEDGTPFVLELPFPWLESFHDVILLEPAR